MCDQHTPRPLKLTDCMWCALQTDLIPPSSLKKFWRPQSSVGAQHHQVLPSFAQDTVGDHTTLCAPFGHQENPKPHGLFALSTCFCWPPPCNFLLQLELFLSRVWQCTSTGICAFHPAPYFLVSSSSLLAPGHNPHEQTDNAIGAMS
jgi:hypothetical protein